MEMRIYHKKKSDFFYNIPVSVIFLLKNTFARKKNPPKDCLFHEIKWIFFTNVV